jgi:hypothetical protein
MKDGDHCDYERKPRPGAEVVPVGRDEQDDARRQQNAAEDESDNSLPVQAGGAFLAGLPDTDAVGSIAFEDARRLPAV